MKNIAGRISAFKASACLLTAMALGQGASASTLSDLAASMKPGEWKELKTIGLNDTLFHLQSTGTLWWANMHTDWSNYLAYNPGSQEIFFLGAGHLVPFGFMHYDIKTNTWNIKNNVPDCMTKDGYNGCFNHGYHQGTIDQGTGTFYFYSESNWFSFDVGKDSWTQWKQSTFEVTRGSGMEWFPALKKIAWVGQGRVRLVDPVTKAVEELATGLSMGQYNNTMTYNPVTQRAYLGGGFGTTGFWAVGTDKKVVKLADAPAGYDCTSSSLVADAVSGEVILIANSNVMYVYRPTTNTWVTGANPPVALNKNEDMAVTATAIPDMGVIFYMSPSLKKAYLYRHAAGTGSVVGVNKGGPAKAPSFRPALDGQSVNAAGRRAVGRTIKFPRP